MARMDTKEERIVWELGVVDENRETWRAAGSVADECLNQRGKGPRY